MLDEGVLVRGLQLAAAALLVLPPALLLDLPIHLAQVHLLEQLLLGAHAALRLCGVLALAVEVALGAALLRLALVPVHAVLGVVVGLCAAEAVALVQLLALLGQVRGGQRPALALVFSEVLLLLPVGDERALVAGVLVVGVHPGGVRVGVHLRTSELKLTILLFCGSY